MANRKNVSTLGNAELTRLRTLLDRYINEAADNPVAEHHAAGNDPSLDIHGTGFIAWHQHFIAKLENWLVVNGGRSFVPLPYWNPAWPIPARLHKNNNTVNLPLPANLRPPALRQIPDYITLNSRMLPYHAAVHNAAGGAMPNPHTSPSDPIFWPFHSFLLAVYERWRNY